MVRLLLVLLLFSSNAYSEEYAYPAGKYITHFDGVYGNATDEAIKELLKPSPYLPYNPVIIEVGAYKGENTEYLSQSYPKGHVIAFEPNPTAFQHLLNATKHCQNVSAYNLALNTYDGSALLQINHGSSGDNEELEGSSSLLYENLKYPNFKGPSIKVPCVVLDDWCEQQRITHAECIFLDCEGFELQILQSSPKILRTVLVVCTKTNFFSFRKGTCQYSDLRAYLESSGFKMLAHWYTEGLQGQAIFIRKYVYDALFK